MEGADQVQGIDLADVALGDHYRDTVTGFEGKATGKLELIGTETDMVHVENDVGSRWLAVGRIESAD